MRLRAHSAGKAIAMAIRASGRSAKVAAKLSADLQAAHEDLLAAQVEAKSRQ
jgi:hypothetical protein